MKYILNIILGLIFFSTANSQNLVNNWSFEDTLGCPEYGGQFNLASNWFTPRGGGGSCELFNICNNYNSTAPGFVGVPYNSYGFQIGKYGNSYAGFAFFWADSIDYREYIETKLFRVLDPSVNYYVEFWVSRANESKYGVENIGAYFSIDTLHYSSNLTTLIYAHVEYFGGIVSDTSNWVKVSGYFKPPSEGYRFLTIGNFNQDDSTNLMMFSGSYAAWGAYYYIDNVVVIDSALQHTIGIESSKFKVQSLKLSVFPNPASADISLEFSFGLNQNIVIQIFNVMGNKVLSEKRYCQNSVNLDVSKLRSGIYFIRVSDESGKGYSEKLIIE